MLLTIIFFPTKDNFVKAQQFNLSWTFFYKTLSSFAELRDNPNDISNNLEMALDEAHVHLNSFVQVNIFSSLPPIQKDIDSTWLIWRPYVTLKRSSSRDNQIMPFRNAFKMKLMSFAYWAIICLLFDMGKQMPLILSIFCSSQILALKVFPIIKNR